MPMASHTLATSLPVGHIKPDHVKTLLFEQARGNGGVHPAAHSDHDALGHDRPPNERIIKLYPALSQSQARYVRLAAHLFLHQPCGAGLTCNEQLDKVYLNTMLLFRRRNYAPLTLVAIRACSSPYAALRRSARLSRGCSSSRRENAETFALLLVPTELSRSSLIFTPRE